MPTSLILALAGAWAALVLWLLIRCEAHLSQVARNSAIGATEQSRAATLLADSLSIPFERRRAG